MFRSTGKILSSVSNKGKSKGSSMRKIASVSTLAITALILTGCAGTPATPGATPSETATPEPVYVTAPLTGIKYEESTDEAKQLTRPSVACKIDNSEAARPQLGLNSTDIVFDEMVEGGLTRLVAIWHSTQPKAVGPVRSIRPMDPDIISPFGGIVCFSGGQRRFVEMMGATKVFNASETTEQGKGTFSRTPDRYAPHNVIVDVDKLAGHHTDLAAPQLMFDFAADIASATATTAGKPAEKFTARYPAATATWTPNSLGTQWLRTQDGKPHLDAADKSQIHATNVVVLNVGIDRSYADHKYGNVPKTVMVGKGTGFVFTGGKYVAINWSKADQVSKIQLMDSTGAAILLAPGNTWVELLPKSPEGKLTVTAPKPAATATPTATK
jgi:hypothetical protein